MAVVYPLAFILRRVLYSVVIVFMAGENQVYFGSLLLLLSSLAMIVIVATEAPWKDSLVNRQHFGSEAVFYFLCVALICFSGPMTEIE